MRGRPSDLVDIWAFGAREWDIATADRYLGDIDAAFSFLQDHPRAGSEDELRGHRFRRWHVGSHVILYRAQRQALRVLRVLHQRMDMPRHFP